MIKIITNHSYQEGLEYIHFLGFDNRIFNHWHQTIFKNRFDPRVDQNACYCIQYRSGEILWKK